MYTYQEVCREVVQHVSLHEQSLQTMAVLS